MQAKTQELESQIKTLETLLANYEIQHVVGEIDEDMYQREMTVLSTSLESARHELNVINEATNQLCPPVEEVATEPDLAVEENVDALQNETEESVVETPAEMEVPAESYAPEPTVTMDESAPEAPSIESEYITPEETPQIVEEMPEVAENPPEITEDIPQTTEYATQETEWQPQVTEDTPQEMNETSEITEEASEITEDFSQAEVVEESGENAEETWQPAEEEVPQVNEPQTLDETIQNVEATSDGVEPLEAPKEAAQEISVEVIADDEQDEAENAEAAESDDETEYEEL